MTTRITRRHCLTLLGAGVGAAAMPGLSHAFDRSTWTATDVHVGDYPTVQAVRWIGEQLAAATDGRLNLRIYHSGQLGREGDQLDLARHGAIDLTRVYSGALNNAFPLTTALGLPYLIRSKTHLRALIDGPVGAAVLAGFAKRDLIGLAIYDCGARCLYNTRGPVHTPADLAGLKVRVPPSDIFLALMRTLGANPTPLPYGEVFSALETRLIDGAENNIRSYQSSRQFEVAKFWSETGHSFAPDLLLMSRSRFDSLSAADRELVLDVARRSVAVFRAAWDEGEAAARTTVLGAGVLANDVDVAAFRSACVPLVAQYRQDTTWQDLIRRIDAETTA